MALDPTRPLNLMSFGAILAEPFPAVDWDIEPLVAHGSRVVIAGMYGSLKSWVLPHMGLSLAAGIDWLNRFRVSRPRRTLFIDEEMSVPGLARRVRRLAKGLGLESPALPFQALSRAGIRFDASGAAWLLQKLKESQFDPEVIFVETLRRVIVGSENDAKDVGEFWRGVDPIMQAGKTLLVSHHMRKPSRQGNDQMRDRVSGSTDIMAGSDSDITIHRPSRDTAILEFAKLRDAEEPLPFLIGFEWDDSDDRSGPVRLSYEGERGGVSRLGFKLEEALELVTGYLSGCPNLTAETGAILAHALAQGCKKKTAERALEQLGEIGSLVSPRRGRWQLVVPERGAA